MRLFDCLDSNRCRYPQILANHGVRGLFKGLSAPLVTVAGFNAVLFAARGNMERLLAHPDGEQTCVQIALHRGAYNFSAWPLQPKLIVCSRTNLWCRTGSLTIADHFVCGAGAGFAGAFVACPTELIKCRLQARSGAMLQVGIKSYL